MVNYEKVIEDLESLEIPYGDYGIDDECATNEALDIAIQARKKQKSVNKLWVTLVLKTELGGAI